MNGATGWRRRPQSLRPTRLHKRGIAMPRAYLRLDPAYDEHKESYPDGPYAALIACLCQAELQPQRGRFRSERFLRALLGSRARHVAYLIAKGDLILLPDGRLYVDGWDEWQEGDWKVAERIRRIRNRNHRDVTVGVTGPVTPDVTVGVTPGVTASRYSYSGAERSGALAERPTVTSDPAFDNFDRGVERTQRMLREIRGEK